jgi:maleylacetate reductase
MHFIHEIRSPRVVFGRDSVAKVTDEVDRIGGQRVLLIGNPRRTGMQRVLAGGLEPRVVGIFDRVQEHVPVQVAEQAASTAASLDVDLLLPVGGGSAIGTAKAVARRTGLPILAVPTTYSGSEMTPIWGETKDQVKFTGRDTAVVPSTVVYDPNLSESMPADIRAASGLNALAHCAEAMYAPDCSPLVRAAALEGARALTRGLRCSRDAPEDANAAEDILYGAWLAGVALSGASMGLHHKLCHVLGGQQRLSHGALHSVLLPYVLAYQQPAAAAALDAFAAAIGDGDAAQAVWDLGRRLGTPTSLSAIGFSRSGIQDVIDAVMAAPPKGARCVESAALRDLLECATRGLPPNDSIRD